MGTGMDMDLGMGMGMGMGSVREYGVGDQSGTRARRCPDARGERSVRAQAILI